MKTWITAKNIDEQIRELRTRRATTDPVLCMYLPNEKLPGCSDPLMPAASFDSGAIARRTVQRKVG